MTVANHNVGPLRQAQLAPPIEESSTKSGVLARAHDLTIPRPRLKASAGWYLRAMAKAPLMLPGFVGRNIKPAFVGLARILAALVRWASNEEVIREIRAKEGHDPNALAKAKDKATARMKASGVVVMTITALITFGTWRYGFLVWLLPLLALIAVCEIVGHLDKPAEDDKRPAPQGPLTHGIPIRSLEKTIEEILETDAKTTAHAAMHPTKHGFAGQLTFTGNRKDDDTLIDTLETGLRTRKGGVLLVQNADDAAVEDLTVNVVDPLAKTITPPDETGGSITSPVVVGTSNSGDAVSLPLHRQHVMVVGASGSGKSGTLWCLLDSLTGMRDVKIKAIDLWRGPAFPAWSRVIDDIAYTPEDAGRILDWAASLASRRGEKLGSQPEDADQNHVPSSASPHWVIMIDELCELGSHPELSRKLVSLSRGIRKAGISLVLATHSTKAQDLGSLGIRGQMDWVIWQRCDRKDVTDFLGAGSLGTGLRPDRLDLPGKAYLTHFGNLQGEVSRIHTLSRQECIQRARSRAGQKPAEVIDAVALPEWLAGMEQAFIEHGKPKALPSEDVLKYVPGELSPRELMGYIRDAELDHILKPDRRPMPDGTQRRGYTYDQIKRAITFLS